LALNMYLICGANSVARRYSMPKTEMIRARVEPTLKHEAEEVFAALGLSPTEAITLFY
jgi:hypothetical protein